MNTEDDHMNHSLVYINETVSHASRASKINGLQWRVLTKCGPLEKGRASHLSILALTTP